MKAQLTAAVSKISGKVSGTVFRHQAGTCIISNPAVPKNSPLYQHIVPVQFPTALYPSKAYKQRLQIATKHWNYLTNAQRKTWYDQAEDKKKGYALYLARSLAISSNILYQPFNEFPGNSTIAPMQGLQITEPNPRQWKIIWSQNYNNNIIFKFYCTTCKSLTSRSVSKSYSLVQCIDGPQQFANTWFFWRQRFGNLTKHTKIFIRLQLTDRNTGCKSQFYYLQLFVDDLQPIT